MIITPKMKDSVLARLLSADDVYVFFDYTNSESDFGFKPEYMDLILNQFEEIGLIRKDDLIGSQTNIHVQIKAMDLHLHGGFTAEEELLKVNIEKLGMELDVLSNQLSPNLAEKASQLAQIASAILQGFAMFK